jgi:hypothetical protein
MASGSPARRGRSPPPRSFGAEEGGPPLTRVVDPLTLEHALDAAIPRGLEAGTVAPLVGERLAQALSGVHAPDLVAGATTFGEDGPT